MIINTNTDKLEENGKKLTDLGIKYENLLKKFYDRINDINKFWDGADATKFIDYINNDKEAYEKIGTNIKQYGEILLSLKNQIKEKNYEK